MGNFDRTIDNRWRPDLESSQRRVKEELREAAAPPVRRPALALVRAVNSDHHDAQTRALIQRVCDLERLPHGAEVNKLFIEWEWLDRMKLPEEKQRFLEPIIHSVGRDPERYEAQLIFLLLVFEPVRRNVSKAFLRAHQGLIAPDIDVNWSNREEARMINNAERQRLFDVTREAALEAIFRYPSPPPAALFPWLRETISHRALDKLRGELPQYQCSPVNGLEADAMQTFLAGFETASQPVLRDRAGFQRWRHGVAMRDVFDVVEDFFEHASVRETCQKAIGRLPSAERQVIDDYFLAERDVTEIAEARGSSESTVYNQKASAQRKLREDDLFFAALYSMHRVRDRARATELSRRYPKGVLPDGRRIVFIGEAA